MSKVLLVSEVKDPSAVFDALSLYGYEVECCTPKEAAHRIRDVRAVVVEAFASDATAPRFVAHLVAALGPHRVPILSVVSTDASARDAALIAGAADVAFAGSNVAVLLDELLEGESVSGPLIALPETLRAQRGRQTFDLKVKALGASGLVLDSAEGLATGQLIRTQLVLASGRKLVWGRVKVEMEPRLRFLGLSPEEQGEISDTVQASLALAPEPAEAPDAVPVPEAPAAVLVPEAPAAVLVPEAPALSSPPPESSPAAPAALAGESSRTAPPTRRESLAAIIDEELDEAPAAEEEPDTREQRSWPEGPIDLARAFERLLLELAAGGVLEHRESADKEALAFLRSLSPIERRTFEAEPPADFLDAYLVHRCLSLRFLCQELTAQASRCLGNTEFLWTVDEEAIAAFKTQVDEARAEIQKVIDGLVAAGPSPKLRDASSFANVLQKSSDGLMAQVARLRGETSTLSGRLTDLDVEEVLPGQHETQRRLPGKAVAQRSEDFKDGYKPSKALSPEQRARRRTIGWVVVLLVVVCLRFVLSGPGVVRLSAEQIGSLDGVLEVSVPPDAADPDRPRAAVVVVTSRWDSGDQVAIARLQSVLSRSGAVRFAVFNEQQHLLATGGTAVGDRVTVIGR